jgi:hypothetical protein
MELLQNLTSKKNYCETIETSTYLQRINEFAQSKVYQNINNLFIDRFDPTCNIVDEKDKSVYMKQRLVEIATDIDEKKETTYDKFNYDKKMKSSLIQNGLQTTNNLSSVLYLSDLYKVTTVVYIESKQNYVETSQKDREKLHILYKDGVFMVLDTPLQNFTMGDCKDLGDCLVMNVKSLSVYNTHLGAIGKYKAPELIEIAKEIQLPLEVNGKKKVKKQLYDEINLYYLNNPV